MFQLDPHFGKPLGNLIAEVLTKELRGTRFTGVGPVFQIISFDVPQDPEDPNFLELMVEVEQLGTVGPGKCIAKFPYIPRASHIEKDSVVEGHKFRCHGFTCLATQWNGMRDEKNRQELDEMVSKCLPQIKRMATETAGGITIDWDYFQRGYFRDKLCQKTKDAMAALLMAVGVLSPLREGWSVYQEVSESSQDYRIELEGHRLVFTCEEEAKRLAAALEAQEKRLSKWHKTRYQHVIWVVECC